MTEGPVSCRNGDIRSDTWFLTPVLTPPSGMKGTQTDPPPARLEVR